MEIEKMIIETQDVEYGQYCWLDYRTSLANNPFHNSKSDGFSLNLDSLPVSKDDDVQPDTDYVNNYYNDDLEKNPNLKHNRNMVISIYVTIGLMFVIKYILYSHV